MGWIAAVTGNEIRQALAAAGVVPSKQLGQNFLIDPNMARWITSQLEAGPDDAVVEVGPGTGALSEHLAGKVRRLVLIEFDARLAVHLRGRFGDIPGVEVCHADGARFDRRALFKHGPVKFLGNLPYSSGGAILKNLLGRPHPFCRAVVMLQKEVIDRLVAGPRDESYGVLSLRVQMDWQVRLLRVAPPELFHPRPRVDSAVALLTPREDAVPFDARLLDELLRRGFAQRRKQLRKQLPASPPWDGVAASLGLAPTARAEELSLAQWIDLARAYDCHPLKDCPQRDEEWFDVVDERDEVTGRATRGEVHRLGLRHRAVHVLVFNKHGEVLLQQRSAWKDAHPGVWDSSVAGHLDAGEDYPDAAVRELAEEMGIRSAIPTEVARLAAGEDTGQEFVRLYQVRHEGAIRFPCGEIRAALWFPPEELDAWLAARPQDFASGFRACWAAWRGRAC